MQVTKNITLDLLETGSPVIIKAKQNDRNTRYIAAHLYVDGLAYPVPNGTEIAFRYKKPDGTAGFYDALPDNSPAITVSGNTVTVELVEQVLTAAGCVHCEINMYNATSEKLTTFTFEIAVEESVLTDAEIISSDYYNVLTAEITKALQAVTDATEQAENAAQSAQDAADSAAMSKDWAAGQPVTYSGAPVSIAYAGANRIASITAYGENAQGGTTEAPVALTGISSVTVDDVTELPIPRPLRRVGDVKDKCVTRQDYESAEKLVVTYNVGFVELDGTEAWRYGAGQQKELIISNFVSAPTKKEQICSHAAFEFNLKGAGFYIVENLLVFGANYTGKQLSLDEFKNYLAAQKEAGTPVQVAYQLATPEVYATDPVDFDNTAGPLTIMTGGELEVRMTELIGSRSDVSNNTVAFSEASQDADIQTGEKLSVLFGKIKKRFSVVNKLVNGAVYPNLLDNSNFTNPVNQRDGTSYSASTGNAAYAIDRWRIEGATYNVATHTLSGTSYTNRACRMAQFIEMAQYGLNIGDDMTFSIMANGTKHSATAKVLDRDQYSNFESVPSAYSCDDFDIVLCTGLGKPSILSFTICAKKSLVLEWAKLEKGSVATPYVHKSYGAELSACQRYFYYLDATKWYACYQITGWGLIIPIDLPVPMRAQPTANTVGEVKVFTPSGWVNATSVSTNQFNRDKARINIVLTMPSGSMDSYEGRAMVATGIESLSADL